MANVSTIISSKTGNDDLLARLQQLSGTELNSILLELFRRRAGEITPTDVLAQFEKNRFTIPSAVDAIAFKELELAWLKYIKNEGFEVVTLSPVAPLGVCSSFKTVDQNNIVSALRGTEVMSDATNMFALLIAQQYKRTKSKAPVKYATAHRLVRAQGMVHASHTPHFGIFCMATGGFNNGSFLFEMEQVAEQLTLHLSLLSSFNKNDLSIKILLKENNETLQQAVTEKLSAINNEYKIEIIQQPDPNNYYQLLQFKTFLNYKGSEINLSDGGFVNWTQQLISNKKHRLLISGIGIELVHKLSAGLV